MFACRDFLDESASLPFKKRCYVPEYMIYVCTCTLIRLSCVIYNYIVDELKKKSLFIPTVNWIKIGLKNIARFRGVQLVFVYTYNVTLMIFSALYMTYRT